MNELTPQRIKARRERLGWSQERLAKKIGVTRAAVSYWETGTTKSLTGENLFKVAHALEVEPGWLLGTPGSEETATGRVGRVRRYATTAGEAQIPTPFMAEDAGGYIPIWRYDYAGDRQFDPHIAYPNPSDALMFRPDLVRMMGLDPDQATVSACFVHAEGDSMAPSITAGCLVVMDTRRRDLKDGRVFAFLVEGEVRIRRVFKHVSEAGWRLSADNENKRMYPDEHIPPNHGITIVGQCVWRAGDL